MKSRIKQKNYKIQHIFLLFRMGAEPDLSSERLTFPVSQNAVPKNTFGPRGVLYSDDEMDKDT